MRKIPRGFFSEAYPLAIVAGGAGFIGSHLSRYLINNGLRVLCIDNLSTGTRANLEDLLTSENFFFLKLDINSKTFNETFFSDKIVRVDYVFHLTDNSLLSIETNSLGTQNLIKLSLKHKAKFVYGSSLFSDLDSGKSFLIGKNYGEVLIAENIEKNNLDGRIVRLGDVYGPCMNLDTGSPLSRLITSYMGGVTLEVPGQDVVLYPTFITDVVDGIAKSVFIPGTRGRVIVLANAGYGMLSVAKTLKDIKSDIRVVFSRELQFLSRQHLEYHEIHGGGNVISWKPNTNIAEGLLITINWFLNNSRRTYTRASKKPNFVDTSLIKLTNEATPTVFWGAAKTSKSGVLKKILSPIFLTFSVFFALLFLVFFSPYVFFAIGSVNTHIAYEKLKSREYLDSERWFKFSTYWNQSSQNVLFLTNGLFFIDSHQENSLRQISLANEVSQTGETVISTFISSIDFLGKIFSSDEYGVAENSSKFINQLKSLDNKLAFTEAQIEETPTSSFFKSIRFYDLNTMQVALTQYREFLHSLSFLINYIPDVLGGTGKKNYLFLFVDETYTKSSGGLISAFILVSFENGRLIKTDVYGVTTADSKLQGEVIPPLPIKNYTTNTNWTLKESNWSINHSVSASRAVWFVDKELGQSVDGVVTVNNAFLKHMLSIFGPFTISPYGQISENNFEKKLSIFNHPKTQDSNEREEFYVAILNRLMDSFDESESHVMFSLVSGLFSEIVNQNVFIYSSNPEIQSSLLTAGFSGDILPDPCTGQLSVLKVKNFCISDRIAVYESNLTSNLPQSFLDRTYALDLLVDENNINHRLLLTYKFNTDKIDGKSNYEAGNYIRINLSKGAKIDSVVLLDPTSGREQLLESQIENEGNSHTVGFYLPMESNQTYQVVVIWDRAFALQNGRFEDSTLDRLFYFVWESQPGVDVPIWLRARFPQGAQISPKDLSLTNLKNIGYNLVLRNPNASYITTKEETSFKYNSVLKSNVIFGINWNSNE